MPHYAILNLLCALSKYVCTLVIGLNINKIWLVYVVFKNSVFEDQKSRKNPSAIISIIP